MQVLGAVRTFARLDPAQRTFAALAWVLAPPVGLALRVFGFERLAPLVDACPVSRLASRSSSVDVETGAALVERVFVRSPARSGCLPQSLVQCLTHRLVGREADLVIGVRKHARIPHEPSDFEAHAWVEERSASARADGHAEVWRSARD